MSEDVLVVRSLRELDAVVAEKLFGWRWVKLPPDFQWFGPQLWPSELIADDPAIEEVVPDRESIRWITQNAEEYTTWGGLEAVIRNREEAGFDWRFDAGHVYVAWIGQNISAKLGHAARGSTPAIAFCLAALLTVGVRVQLEVGE